MMGKNWKQAMNLERCSWLLIFLLIMPSVISQEYIDTDIGALFLANENVNFFVRINNPAQEPFEGRLLVEVISSEENIKILEEKLNLYPGDLYLKSFDERFKEGDYKVRIELKDIFFDRIIDQKILGFKVIEDCSTKDICNYKDGYQKCDVCRKNPNAAFWILGGLIGTGIVLLFYLEVKRRRALR